MGTLMQDLRYAARMLLKNAGFTAVVVVTLALGIGANTAIFSVVNGVVLKPLPYSDPDRLVMVWETSQKWKRPRGSVSYPNFADWRQQSTVFEQMGTFSRKIVTLTELDPPEAVVCARVSAGLFPTLGVQAALGNLFHPADDLAGAENVVLSDSVWRRRLGGNPDIIGQTIALGGTARTVRGVLPPGFKCPIGSAEPELWAPQERQNLSQRSKHYLKVIARLRPNTTLQQAQTQMDTIARRLEEEHPDTNRGRGVRVAALHKEVVGHARPVLLILLGAVAVVLLIACTNVANLLLARNTTRGKEYAVRAALGAGRLHLIRLLLTESLLLGLLGAGLGIILAVWAVDALAAVMPADFPHLDDIALDARVLGFTVGITLLAVLMFGLAPAVYATGANLCDRIRDDGRSSPGAGRSRPRAALVVAQLAMALTLLIGAGLLVRSFHKVMHVDPGFVPDNMLTFQMAARQSEDYNPRRRAELYGQVLERLASLPGVQAVAASATLPWSGSNIGRSFAIPDRSEPISDERLYTSLGSVSTDYFRALGIPLLKGRFFTKQDVRAGHGVAIINEMMARRFWPNDDPVGQIITFPTGSPDDDGSTFEIIGVVGNVRASQIDTPAAARVYAHYQQDTWPFMCFALRTTRDPLELASAVRSEAAALSPDEALHNVKTLEQHLADAVGPRRFPALLLGIFALVALVVAAVGVYGVLSYSVARRTHEIGLRMALGAQRSNVLCLVLRQGLTLTIIGLVIGLAISLAGTRLLSGLLYEIGTTDSLTFIGVSLLLAAVALLACYLPARRATKVDPMVALRCE